MSRNIIRLSCGCILSVCMFNAIYLEGNSSEDYSYSPYTSKTDQRIQQAKTWINAIGTAVSLTGQAVSELTSTHQMQQYLSSLDKEIKALSNKCSSSKVSTMDEDEKQEVEVQCEIYLHNIQRLENNEKMDKNYLPWLDNLRKQVLLIQKKLGVSTSSRSSSHSAKKQVIYQSDDEDMTSNTYEHTSASSYDQQELDAITSFKTRFENILSSRPWKQQTEEDKEKIEKIYTTLMQRNSKLLQTTTNKSIQKQCKNIGMQLSSVFDEYKSAGKKQVQQSAKHQSSYSKAKYDYPSDEDTEMVEEEESVYDESNEKLQALDAQLNKFQSIIKSRPWKQQDEQTQKKIEEIFVKIMQVSKQVYESSTDKQVRAQCKEIQNTAQQLARKYMK